MEYFKESVYNNSCPWETEDFLLYDVDHFFYKRPTVKQMKSCVSSFSVYEKLGETKDGEVRNLIDNAHVLKRFDNKGNIPDFNSKIIKKLEKEKANVTSILKKDPYIFENTGVDIALPRWYILHSDNHIYACYQKSGGVNISSNDIWNYPKLKEIKEKGDRVFAQLGYDKKNTTLSDINENVSEKIKPFGYIVDEDTKKIILRNRKDALNRVYGISKMNRAMDEFVREQDEKLEAEMKKLRRV